MENSGWSNEADILDDFDSLCDFYNPKLVEEKKKWLNLPRCVRGRGRKVVSSDESGSDSDNETAPDAIYIPKADMQDLDPEKELEIQEQLRKAVGLGYSNNLIEHHWKKSDVPDDNDPSDTNDLEWNQSTVSNESPSSKKSNCGTNESTPSSSTKATFDEPSLHESSSSSESEVEESLASRFHKLPTDFRTPSGITMDDYISSDDENIVLESTEIEKGQSTKPKAKFVPIPVQKVVEVKSVKLNPYAKEFVVGSRLRHNTDFTLNSVADFPPL